MYVRVICLGPGLLYSRLFNGKGREFPQKRVDPDDGERAIVTSVLEMEWNAAGAAGRNAWRAAGAHVLISFGLPTHPVAQLRGGDALRLSHP